MESAFPHKRGGVKILWFCILHSLFAGQNSDAIYLVVLTLGVMVVMFSSEGAEV